MPTITIDKTTYWLDKGSHIAEDESLCLLEIAAIKGGEPLRDDPESVSNVLAIFGRGLWDTAPDSQLGALAPWADRLIGTAGRPNLDDRAALAAMVWILNEYLPPFLDLAGYTEDAKFLASIQVANWDDLFFLQRQLNDLAIDMSSNTHWAPLDFLFESLFTPIMGAIAESKISDTVSDDPVRDHLVRTLHESLWSLTETTVISARVFSAQEQIFALRKGLWYSGKDLYDQILGLWEK